MRWLLLYSSNVQVPLIALCNMQAVNLQVKILVEQPLKAEKCTTTLKKKHYTKLWELWAGWEKQQRERKRKSKTKVKKITKKKLETTANSELRGWPRPTRQQGQRQLCTFVCRHVHSINFEQICICYSYDNNNTLARTHPHAHTHTKRHCCFRPHPLSWGGNASSFSCSRKAETKLSTQRPFPVFVCCWTFDWARFATAFCHT